MVCGRRILVKKEKTLGSAAIPLTPSNHLVPEGRVELPRAQSPLDFESSASTSFTTPACKWCDYSEALSELSMLFSLAQSVEPKAKRHRAWSLGLKLPSLNHFYDRLEPLLPRVKNPHFVVLEA